MVYHVVLALYVDENVEPCQKDLVLFPNATSILINIENKIQTVSGDCQGCMSVVAQKVFLTLFRRQP